MKTVKVKFGVKYAEQAAILFASLDIQIIMTWTIEGFMDENLIYCILRINEKDTDKIPMSLQLEKLREKSFIKFF